MQEAGHAEFGLYAHPQFYKKNRTMEVSFSWFCMKKRLLVRWCLDLRCVFCFVVVKASDVASDERSKAVSRAMCMRCVAMWVRLLRAVKAS